MTRGSRRRSARAAARRVRIIGAEQAASVVPPEGFAVTDDPLEADSVRRGRRRSDRRPSRGTGRSPASSISSGLPPSHAVSTSPSSLTGPIPRPARCRPCSLAMRPDLPEWQRAGRHGPRLARAPARLGGPWIRALDARQTREPGSASSGRRISQKSAGPGNSSDDDEDLSRRADTEDDAELRRFMEASSR